jgi:hypothetical protein
MKKYIIVTTLLVLFVFNSCYTTRTSTPTILKLNRGSLCFLLTIDKGGEVHKIDYMEETGIECLYPDSSLIYISPYNGNPNNINLQNLNDSVKKDRLWGLYEDYNMDTMDFQGLDDNILYWRDIFYKDKGVSIGYINTPIDKKERYDKILENVEIVTLK